MKLNITATRDADSYLGDITGPYRVELAKRLVEAAKNEAYDTWGLRIPKARWTSSVHFVGGTVEITFTTVTPGFLRFYVDNYRVDGTLVTYRVELSQ